jgi:DNA-binding MarR family transcriptional regulator
MVKYSYREALVTEPLVASASSASEADRLFQALVRLMRLESRRLAPVLVAHDLTKPQFFTLRALQHQRGGCRMGDLAHQLFESSPTLTGIVARLEESGLVERVMDPSDRRAVLVRLTERGARLLRDVTASQHENLARALDHIDPAERREFLRLLHAYLDALEANFT